MVSFAHWKAAIFQRKHPKLLKMIIPKQYKVSRLTISAFVQLQFFMYTIQSDQEMKQIADQVLSNQKNVLNLWLLC
jgi:hypothetical protein